MNQELAVPQLSTVQLISNARRALAEARTLPDFRQVMEVASVAADAAKRAAKLMEAQGMAAEVVKQANEAANDAAAVRIEAQVGAGRIIREMRESGQLAGRGNRTGRNQFNKESTLPAGIPKTLPEIGVDDHDAGRWLKLAEVPDNVRVEYLDTVREDGGEITTAGLLRYARPKLDDEHKDSVQLELERAYDNVTKAMVVLVQQYRNAGAIAAYAADSRRKSHFRDLVSRTRAWVKEANEVLR